MSFNFENLLISTGFSTGVENSSWVSQLPRKVGESTTTAGGRTTRRIDTTFDGTLRSVFLHRVNHPSRESVNHEAHVSTQSPPPSQNPRISCPHGDQERPHRPQAPPRQGPEASD